MSATRSVLLASALAGAVLVLAGCQRERRDFDTPPHIAAAASVPSDRLLHVGPGASEAAPSASTAEPASTGPLVPSSTLVPNPAGHENDEKNAFAVSQGKRLFHWFNCNGCHGAGGGNMGPALSDSGWLYGASPAQVAASIMQGRPNGMPSFAGRLTDDQLWQIVAYVRSLSGQLASDVAPSRGDAISPGKPESQRKKERPRPAASS